METLPQTIQMGGRQLYERAHAPVRVSLTLPSAKPTLAAILSLPRTAWHLKRNPSLRRVLICSRALRCPLVGELRGNGADAPATRGRNRPGNSPSASGPPHSSRHMVRTSITGLMRCISYSQAFSGPPAQPRPAQNVRQRLASPGSPRNRNSKSRCRTLCSDALVFSTENAIGSSWRVSATRCSL